MQKCPYLIRGRRDITLNCDGFILRDCSKRMAKKHRWEQSLLVCSRKDAGMLFYLTSAPASEVLFYGISRHSTGIHLFKGLDELPRAVIVACINILAVAKPWLDKHLKHLMNQYLTSWVYDNKNAVA